MPRTCATFIKNPLAHLKHLFFIANPAHDFCEFIAVRTPFLGIWGEFDAEETETLWYQNFLDSINQFINSQYGTLLLTSIILFIASFLIGLGFLKKMTDRDYEKAKFNLSNQKRKVDFLNYRVYQECVIGNPYKTQVDYSKITGTKITDRK